MANVIKFLVPSGQSNQRVYQTDIPYTGTQVTPVHIVIELDFDIENQTQSEKSIGTRLMQNTQATYQGIEIPADSQYKPEYNSNGLTANSQYRVTLTAPKNGLMVSGSTIVQATGNDNTSATTKVTFVYVNYIGKVTAAAPTESAIKSLTSGQTSSRSKSVSGVTASKTEYYCYAYPASLGNLTSIVQDGATPVLGAFNKTVVQVTTASGKKIDYNVYTSKNPGAFNNANLAFA